MYPPTTRGNHQPLFDSFKEPTCPNKNEKLRGKLNPGSQPPILKWWFLLDDDKPLLK